MDEPGAAALNTASAHETGLYDSSKHDNQIVALYETRAQADAAKAKLVSSGVDAGAIQVMDREADRMAGGVDYESGNQGLWGAVKSMFMPDEDAHAYNHALGAGHSMVVVTPHATADRSQIIHALESTNPMDFDAKLEEWRQAGYSSTPAATTGTTTTATTGVAAAPAVAASTAAVGTAAVGANETLKVMEERLRVGKREVAGGAVRVRSYVVERPVEEQVSLHEERVSLERNPVDRPATAADLAAFKEGTIEARATSEEAVVGKEARVIEEIGVRKEATERVETIRDTVRSTKVEVEDGTKVVPGATTTGVTGTSVPGTTDTNTGVSGASSTSTPGATTSGMNAPRK
jgi:uncharacterized protein (TIGR02271 family)